MNKRLTFLYVILLLFSSLFLSAQNSPLFLSSEGGGNGLVASANIGKPVITRQRYKIIFQTGLGWAPNIAKPQSVFSVPAQLTCNFGENGMYMEAGVGASLIPKSKLHTAYSAEGKSELYISPIIGFRHESPKWFGRVYACPLFHLNGEHIYDPITKDFIKFGVGIGTIL